MDENIEIYGIETNNLKNIDVSIKKDAINLILGPSGSGKSSLAYDTIAQIGQYEYMSMFADDYMEPKYKVKGYRHMIAAVPIRQTNFNNNIRSTIGTYFGLNQSIAFIYSALTGADQDHFILNKETNVCENCHGLGTVRKLDPNKIINWDIPLNKVPIRCWNRYKDFYAQIIGLYCADLNIDARKNFRQLTDAEREMILEGSSERKYTVKYKKTNRLASRTTRYQGVLTDIPMLPGYNVSNQFFSDFPCECCQGKKYSREVETIKIDGISIGQFMTMPFSKLQPVLNEMQEKYNDTRLQFSFKRIHSFVDMAISNKLGHLFFHRAIPTLSGGELQRLRLVQVFNTQLSGLMIVLDEPLAGLSADEKKSVYENVIKLAKHHTVVLVDHGETFLHDAKQVYVLGPGGGTKGGQIINTDDFIALQHNIPVLDVRKAKDYRNVVINSNIYSFNGINVSIAMRCMNLIFGKSGVGKSTLLREYLPQYFENYAYISQKPLTGNSNSNVATILDIFVRITELFAKKYGKDRKFFANQTGCEGACPKCGGAGYIEYNIGDRKVTKIECMDCEGTGFNNALEKYTIGGKTIFEIWRMTIDDAADFFWKKDKFIWKKLETAKSLLLGHLQIGQSTETLSGGENIRIKILKQYRSTAEILGIDEPFKGLSNNEIFAVAKYLNNIIDSGKTIIVVDHTEEAKKYFANIVELKLCDGVLTGLKGNG